MEEGCLARFRRDPKQTEQLMPKLVRGEPSSLTGMSHKSRAHQLSHHQRQVRGNRHHPILQVLIQLSSVPRYLYHLGNRSHVLIIHVASFPVFQSWEGSLGSRSSHLITEMDDVLNVFLGDLLEVHYIITSIDSLYVIKVITSYLCSHGDFCSLSNFFLNLLR